MLPAATLQALLSIMFVQAVKNTDIQTEHSKLMRNEYTNKLRYRYNTTHNLLFAYILEVFTMNERYKLNAQLALAFHPELDVAKSTAIHEYFVSLCAAK